MINQGLVAVPLMSPVFSFENFEFFGDTNIYGDRNGPRHNRFTKLLARGTLPFPSPFHDITSCKCFFVNEIVNLAIK